MVACFTNQGSVLSAHYHDSYGVGGGLVLVAALDLGLACIGSPSRTLTLTLKHFTP